MINVNTEASGHDNTPQPPRVIPGTQTRIEDGTITQQSENESTGNMMRQVLGPFDEFNPRRTKAQGSHLVQEVSPLQQSSSGGASAITGEKLARLAEIMFETNRKRRPQLPESLPAAVRGYRNDTRCGGCHHRPDSRIGQGMRLG